MAQQASAPFTVIGQTYGPEADPNGGIRNVWTIQFRTASGTVGFVKVADADYNADNVGRLINAKVQHVEAVNALGQ